MLCKLLVTVGLGIAMGAGSCAAQDVGAENLPGATRVVRPPEVPVSGLTKRPKKDDERPAAAQVPEAA